LVDGDKNPRSLDQVGNAPRLAGLGPGKSRVAAGCFGEKKAGGGAPT